MLEYLRNSSTLTSLDMGEGRVGPSEVLNLYRCVAEIYPDFLAHGIEEDTTAVFWRHALEAEASRI